MQLSVCSDEPSEQHVELSRGLKASVSQAHKMFVVLVELRGLFTCMSESLNN